MAMTVIINRIQQFIGTITSSDPKSCFINLATLFTTTIHIVLFIYFQLITKVGENFADQKQDHERVLSDNL